MINLNPRTKDGKFNLIVGLAILAYILKDVVIDIPTQSIFGGGIISITMGVVLLALGAVMFFWPPVGTFPGMFIMMVAGTLMFGTGGTVTLISSLLSDITGWIIVGLALLFVFFIFGKK